MDTKVIGAQTRIPINRGVITTPRISPPTPSNSKLKRFLSLPKSPIDFFTRLTRASALSFAFLTTTPFFIGLNELLTSSRLTPIPNTNKNSNSEVKDSQIKIDNFAKSFSGFEIILEALLKTDVKSLKELDGNKNGIALDSKQDFEDTIALLEKELLSISDGSTKQLYKEAIRLLIELRDLNKLVWGDDGPDPSKISQVYDGDCTIVAEVIGALQTQDKVQKLKGDIKAVSYDLNREKVDLEVKVNGEPIVVCDEDYREYYLEEARGPAAIIYALRHNLMLTGFIGDLTYLSAASTLLTGEKYYTIPVWALSNKALEQILTEAPSDSTIKLATYPSISDYLSNKSKSLDDYKVSKNGLYLKHTYVVKGHKYEDDELKIILQDGLNWGERKLSIEKLREEILFISAPASTINFLDKHSLITWLIVLTLVSGITLATPTKIKNI